ncbi:MAG: hypothetical protein UE295_09830 [Acutalibacteraceae bacterium]|nr:hypothetical protein [Acutalibacteraceae bacterium]
MKLKEVDVVSTTAQKKRKNKFKFEIKRNDAIIYSVTVVLVVYAVVCLISQNININKKTAELEEINNQIIIEEVKNEEITDILNSNKNENAAYIEKTAREDLDYAYKDERIFINISGE